MGRDIGSVGVDKKPNAGVNMKSNGISRGTNHNSPKPSGESVNVRLSVDKEEIIIGVKITNQETVSAASGLYEDNAHAALHMSSNTDTFPSPINIQHQSQSSPFFAPRAHKSYSNKYHDEEDNWSLASSAATSRTVRSRVTVGVAPSFRSAQRAAQRKEFYTKLEQKHQALKAEKMEYEARTKLPLTRAKSPNLTRRKSCGDTTTHSTIDEKALCSKVRHSLGSYKPGSATSSPIKQTQGRNINGLSKPKDRNIKPANETPKVSHLKVFK
ncbi:hypothetical protein M8C21_030109 [Ambrosia artemisiifolia]|uniref:TPX2 C-terminal domain-containing protein n=1 Tax=Ambrosia artemisiifolia TaxID=4212 RepID=A0AAD5GQI3_AMBAR|nr:hypothetical protein M8C21_030109 [Ambrosia artemisiifolia]